MRGILPVADGGVTVEVCRLGHDGRVRYPPENLPDAALDFLVERHLATLTTLRPDGRPHVTPVAFTWDDDQHVARVITSGTAVKARNAAAGGRAVLCQVDGWRWLSLEGTVRVLTEAAAVADAERRHAQRYRVPRANPERVVVQVDVDRVVGLLERPARLGTVGGAG